jgi:hypothetical protein
MGGSRHAPWLRRSPWRRRRRGSSKESWLTKTQRFGRFDPGFSAGSATRTKKIDFLGVDCILGKRDKYRYEVECVIDVPIGYILNR